MSKIWGYVKISIKCVSKILLNFSLGHHFGKRGSGNLMPTAFFFRWHIIISFFFFDVIQALNFFSRAMLHQAMRCDLSLISEFFVIAGGVGVKCWKNIERDKKGEIILPSEYEGDEEHFSEIDLNAIYHCNFSNKFLWPSSLCSLLQYPSLSISLFRQLPLRTFFKSLTRVPLEIQ